MGIQSRLVTAETPEAPSYPFLARYENDGTGTHARPVPGRRQFVVLFLEPQRGIVVQANEDAAFKVGYETDSWCRECFVPLTGAVTMSNA